MVPKELETVTAEELVEALQSLFPLQLQVAAQQVQIQKMADHIARSSKTVEESSNATNE